MSISVMTRVWEHSRARHGTLLVLLAIADCADDQGTAYPSVRKLAAKARLSDRGVQDALRDLADLGELTVSVGTGPKRANTYTVLLPSGRAERPAKESPGEGADSAPRRNCTVQKLHGAEIARCRIPQERVQNLHPSPSPAPPPPYRGEGKPSVFDAKEPSKEPSRSLRGSPAESQPVAASPQSGRVGEPSSALGFFLDTAKAATGRTPTLPNAAAAGAMAKRLEERAGQDCYRTAVRHFFEDPWYLATYGASFAKFHQNFETVLARATVPPPEPKVIAAPPPPRRLSPTEQRRMEGEAEINRLFDGLIDQYDRAQDAQKGHGTHGNQPRIAGAVEGHLSGTQPPAGADFGHAPGRDRPGVVRRGPAPLPDAGPDRGGAPRDTPGVRVLPDRPQGR